MRVKDKRSWKRVNTIFEFFGYLIDPMEKMGCHQIIDNYFGIVQNDFGTDIPTL